MNIGQDIVKPEDERPVRRDGTCFYCNRPIGQAHKPGCVILQRTIVVEATIKCVVSIPRDWDQQMIQFHFNEGSWCADNMMRWMGDWEQAKGDEGLCSCAAVAVEYIREATPADHDAIPVIGLDV